MSATEVVASVLLNLIPVFAILFFYPFIRKPVWRRLYVRLSLCFLAFWFGYYILPVFLFSLIVQPTPFDLSGVYNPWLSALGYHITIFLNFLTIFIKTALFVMPFAFFFAPLISVIILLIYLRGEKGSFKEKIDEVSYSYELSPLQKVRDRLVENVWKEEKELFKLMIVFLPISLYVLTLILTILSGGTAAPGAIMPPIFEFIEDLVAYLASFLAAVYLLYSSKLSFRGRSLGDRIRFSVNRFLLRTGTILALFSIIAFVIQFSQSLITLTYFVIHYVMMSVIFAILLPLFEPFGSFLLIKTINAFKKFDLKAKLSRIFSRRIFSPLVLGFAMASVALLIGYLISLFPTGDIYKMSGIDLPVTFSEELQFIRSFMIIAMEDVLELFVIAVILTWFARQQNASILGTVLSTAFFSSLYYVVLGVVGSEIPIVTNLILTGKFFYWVTAVPAVMTAPGFSLPASRLATLDVSNSSLAGGSALFLALSPILFLLFLTYLLKYWKHPLSITRKVEGNEIIENAYSALGVMPGLKELKRSPEGFFFKYDRDKKASTSLEGLTPETRKDVENLIGKFGSNGFSNLSDLVDATKLKEKRLYEILRFLVYKRAVGVYGLEFASTTPKVVPQSLFVISKEGLDLFHYSFGVSTLDPALISGMLTAITSFVKEATRSRQYLRTIEHGDVILIVEFGNLIFATIIADHETPELRIKLRKFLGEFEKKHARFLVKWTGSLPELDKEKAVVESLFGQ